MAVSPISSIPDSAFASLDGMMGAPVATSASASSTGTLKSIWKFLQGDWGTSVGKAYKEAKKAGLTKGITDFDWKKAYSDYHAKAAADAAAEAAKIASGEVKKGIFGKLFGGLKKNFGPIVTAAFFLPRIVKAFATDGIGEGLKEVAKAAISLTAFAIGSVIVGMLGLTGVLGFVAMLAIPMISGHIADKAANKVLGESKADQREALEAKSNEVQQLAQINAQSIAKNDPVMESIRKRVMEDKYCTSPFLSTTARTQYSV